MGFHASSSTHSEGCDVSHRCTQTFPVSCKDSISFSPSAIACLAVMLSQLSPHVLGHPQKHRVFFFLCLYPEKCSRGCVLVCSGWALDRWKGRWQRKTCRGCQEIEVLWSVKKAKTMMQFVAMFIYCTQLRGCFSSPGTNSSKYCFAHPADSLPFDLIFLSVFSLFFWLLVWLLELSVVSWPDKHVPQMTFTIGKLSSFHLV